MGQLFQHIVERGAGRGLRCGLGVLGTVLLGGCLATPLEQGQADLGEPVLQQASLVAGAVTVSAPQGYCIQRDSLQSGQRGGFALIASCSQLTGFASGYQVPPVVMTVTAVPHEGESVEPSGAEVAAALQGQQVLRHMNGDGLTLVQVKSPTPMIPESDVTHWRGIMVVNDYTVGLALYGAKGSADAGSRGQTQLMWLAERLRSQSPEGAVAVAGSGALSGGASTKAVLRPVARPGSR